MGVRFKVISIIMMFGTLLLVGQYLFSNIFFMDNVIEQEENSVVLETNRVKLLLEQYNQSLGTMAKDWAQRDETAKFINTLVQTDIDTNLSLSIERYFSSSTMANLKINIAAFFDNNNRLKDAIFYDSNSKTITELPDGLNTYLKKNSPLLCDHENHKNGHSGIINFDQGSMMITSVPITDPSPSEPLKGTLLFGRSIDDNLINSIEHLTNSKIELLDLDSVKNDSHSDTIDKDALNEMIGSEKVVVNSIDKETVAGHSVLRNINNEPTLLLKVSMKRDMYAHGKKALQFFTLNTLGIGAVITLICIFLLQKNIVTPILKLSKDINNLDLNNLSFNKLIIKGKDEISNLANEINKMLTKIGSANEELASNKRQLELVLKGADLGFWDLNIVNRTLYLSQKMGQFIGYVPEQISIDSPEFEKLIHKDDLELIHKEFNKALHSGFEVENLEFRMVDNKGEYIWIAIKGSIVESDQNNRPVRMAGIVSNIHEKKRVEQELQYLTYYDKATGLYNRGYFEYLLNKKLLQEEYPFSIIIGDINGLKMVNDTFGHTVGDKMISAVANVFKNICREKDIVTRWGGDEFALILDKADDKIADNICSLIKEECLKIINIPINISIAIGYSTITGRHQSIQDVIKEAEERMYRNKLFESKSARNSIISSLRKSLAEKSHETEEHTSRIYEQCIKIGKKLKMSNAKLDELALLAFLHDIGKIAIPDYILNKPGRLNEEEWEIMKTHTEIGYRIANVSQELNHIAYAILSHHERFDGLGYPKGLKGEEIPIISRIVAVVDSFDVMTHDRPYKTAMTIQEGIEELKRCSGTQFDPEIVEVFIVVLEEGNFPETHYDNVDRIS